MVSDCGVRLWQTVGLYDAWSHFWVPVATAAAVAVAVTVAIYHFTLLVHYCLTISPVTPYLTLKFVELPV